MLRIHTLDPTARFVEGPWSGCELHPTRPWVAVTETRSHNGRCRAGVFDLTDGRALASWTTRCLGHTVSWVGDHLLERLEIGDPNTRRIDLALRELPDGGVVAEHPNVGFSAPQSSRDQRWLYVPQKAQGTRFELPSLTPCLAASERPLGAERWSDSCLHPDGHTVAVLREDAAQRWQLVLRAFSRDRELSSTWVSWPDFAGNAKAAPQTRLAWIDARRLLLARYTTDLATPCFEGRLWTLLLDDLQWSVAPLAETDVRPHLFRHESSTSAALVAAVLRPPASGPFELRVLDPASGACLARRAWDARRGLLREIGWMDPRRLALLSARQQADHHLDAWDFADDSLTRVALPDPAEDTRFAYRGHRDGTHVLLPSSFRGMNGVLLIDQA